jgi:large subunit ribosomal protein L25
VSQVSIAAESRDEFGKGAARRLRRDGKIPAVVYGHGGEPRHVALPGHELMLALKTSNVLLELQLDGGGTELTLPKSIQRDPVKYTLEHVDLVTVKLGEKVTVDVPLVTVGNPEPGGLLENVLSTLSVESEATHIPQSIEVTVDGLPVGGSIHAGQIALAEGLTLITDADAVVIHYLSPSATSQEEAAVPSEAPVEAAAEASAEA